MNTVVKLTMKDFMMMGANHAEKIKSEKDKKEEKKIERNARAIRRQLRGGRKPIIRS